MADKTFNSIILNNLSWNLIEKVFRIAISFFVSILVIKYFGAKEYGIFAFAFSLISLTLPISSLGYENLLVKEVQNNSEPPEVIIGSTLFSRFIASIALALISISSYLIFFEYSEQEFYAVLILALSSLFYPFQNFDYFFKGTERAKLSTYALTTSFLIASLYRIFIVYNKLSLYHFAFSYVIESIIFGIVISKIYFNNHAEKLRISVKYIKKISTEALPLILGAILVTIYMKIDQIMIRKMLSVSDVGQYSVAVKFSEFWFVLPAVISTSVAPQLARLYQADYHLFRKQIQFYLGLLFWIFLTIAIFFYFFADNIMHIFFNEQYNQAISSLKIHPFSGIIASMGVLYSYKYVFQKRSYIPLFGSLIGVILNIFLNFILLKQYGIKGAAIATIICYSLPPFLSGIFFDRELISDYFKAILRPFISISQR